MRDNNLVITKNIRRNKERYPTIRKLKLNGMMF